MAARTQTRLSDALRARLVEKAWSQKKLAEFLEKDDSTVSIWVSGRQAPRVEDAESIAKLARFLGTTADHVRSLVSAQKGPDAAVTSVQQRVTSLPGLLTLIENNAFLRPLVERQYGRPSAAGLRDRLFEEGYAVEESVIEKYLAGHPLRTRGAVRALGGVATLGGIAESAELPDSVEFREAVRQVCRALDALFAGRNNVTDRGEAEQVAGTACSPFIDSRVAADVTHAVIAKCLELRLLQPAGEQQLTRRWSISAEFVLNSLRGLRSGIRNLDFLLDGGWLPPVEGGLAILAKGRAGRGKTMFALQTAASFAAHGHVSIYLTAEESASRLLSRLSYAGYASLDDDSGWQQLRTPDGRTIELLSTNDLEEDDDQTISRKLEATGRGCLLLVEAPQRRGLFRPNSRLLLCLEKILVAAQNAQPKARYLLTIFDSLDALDPQNDRRSQEHVFGFAKLQGSMVLMSSEVHDGRPQPSIRDHLADIVLRFDVRERVSGFTERVLEIEKCRTQSHIRGEHMFAIHGGRGITVYPSIQALMSVWRRRVRKPVEQPVESWKLPDLDFDAVLGGDLARGSAILLSGPPHTHRFLLGLSFLASGLKANRDEHVILVSLREDPPAIYRIIASYPQLHDLLDPDRPDELNQRFRVLHIPPDYFAPERFIHWLQSVFAEYREPSPRVGRVLFSSINQLLHNSPIAGVEQLFAAALLELFKRKRVTSLFLASEAERTAEISSAFDVIIFTACEEDDLVTLRVAHSGPCNAMPGDKVVTKTARPDGARLRLEDSRAKV